jgi:hypothetical protein
MNLPQLSESISRQARVRGILIALALLAAVLAVMGTAPFGMAALKIRSGGQGMLDMDWGYSLATVQGLFGRLGPGGRSGYQALLLLDCLLAAALAALQSFMLSRLVRRAGLPGAFGIINLLPWLRSLLDLGENLLLCCLLGIFPALPVGPVTLACSFTITKWIVYYLVLAMLLTLGALATRTMLRGRLAAAAKGA